MGLAERLVLLAVALPEIFLGPYTSVMALIRKAERGTRKEMTQGQKILNILRKGATVTNIDLIVHHKIASPTKRISELRRDGYNIESFWKRCPLDGSEYKAYRLAEVPLMSAAA